jgi:hypothetical protein
LDHVEVHFSNGEKVGAVLHSLGHRAATKAVGDLEDLPASDSLQAVVGATSNELAVDFDLNKRKVIQPNKRETFRTKIVNRNSDIAEPNLSGDGSC